MSILYAGDIHGNLDAVIALDAYAVKHGIDHVVQVGDWGLGWPGDDRLKPWFRKRGRQNRPGPTWYTCGGNHDNWTRWLALEAETNEDLVELAPRMFYIRRGSRLTIDGITHAVLGGAESIDRHRRVQGTSWWPEETPSRQDVERFFDSLEAGVDVVVTHDCPLETSSFDHGDRDQQPTPQALQRVLDLLYAPRRAFRWYFGHHHVLQKFDGQGTSSRVTYFCCGLEGQGFVGETPVTALEPTRWWPR